MSHEPFRILIVHNHYGDFAVGGEAGVMRAETDLLRSRGHEVLVYERTNAELATLSPTERLRRLWRMPWSPESQRAVGEVLDRFRPDIMHVHNYWLMLGPSIFAAAKERGVTTVLTLHNYRLVCPGGQFLSRGLPCEDCLDGRVWRSVSRRCYPGRSLLKTLLSLRLYRDSRSRGFLASWVDGYIALSRFAGRKFAEAGLPARKIHVKPNFITDPLPPGRRSPEPGTGAVFVGRLSEEKGIESLMEAWKAIPAPLTVVGEGPLIGPLASRAPSHVSFVGARPRHAVLDHVRGAAFLVLPSLCYEGFPLTVLEAMAVGRAVVASDLGPRREMVQDGVTGFLFRSGDIEDLRRKARRLIDDPDLSRRLGARAREVYLDHYTPDMNYRELMTIFGRAREASARRRGTNQSCARPGGLRTMTRRQMPMF